MFIALSFLSASAVSAVTIDGNGSWSVMAGQTGSLCIHSLLLPGNKLVCIERPHTHPYPWINPLTNGSTSTLVHLNLQNNSISFVLNPLRFNAFCAGHSQKADGGIYVIGGDRQSSTFTHDASVQTNVSEPDDQTFLFYGIQSIRTFTIENGWDESQTMTTERWYPTVVTMGDGDAFIASGSKKNLDFDNLSDTNNPTYEFYPRRHQDAIHSQILDWAFPHNLYPIAFQLPSGKIFLMVSNRTVLIDPTVDPGEMEANTIEIAAIPAFDHAPFIYPHTPTAFLLPLRETENYTATVMICGGTKLSNKLASNDCLTIQPDVPGTQWKFAASMPHGRLMPDAAILPDGTVLLTNGDGWGQAGGNGGDCEYGSAPLFVTDLYNPDSNSWSTVGKSSVARMYHSGALLLDDATVITTGSEMANYLDFWGTPDATGPLNEFANVNKSANSACFPTVQVACTDPYEMRIERFTPAYLLSANSRPILQELPFNTTLIYGSTVGITLDAKGPAATRVTLVRYTCTTHSTNTDQRLVEPALLFANASYVVFKVPGNANVAPPGSYHLFVLSKEGVPSVAQRVLLGGGVVTAVNVPNGGVTVPTAATSSKSEALRLSCVIAAVIIVMGFVI